MVVRKHYKDGCKSADSKIGGESSCFKCPFEDCVYEQSVKVVDGWPEVCGISGIRPQLLEGDLVLICDALRVYSECRGDDSVRECCLKLLRRVLRKRVKWDDENLHCLGVGCCIKE